MDGSCLRSVLNTIWRVVIRGTTCARSNPFSINILTTVIIERNLLVFHGGQPKDRNFNIGDYVLNGIQKKLFNAL